MSHILVVDDEQRILTVYKNLFEREGHCVVTAADVTQASKHLMSDSIDLVLLDINIGDFQGQVIYEIVKSYYHHTRIIVSSLYPIEEQHNLMPQATDYFDKSQGNQVLISKVTKVLQEAGSN